MRMDGRLFSCTDPADSYARGATVALNFVDPSENVWDCWQVETLANARKLSLRAGCHCNPGAREVALDIPRVSWPRASGTKPA